MTRLDLDNLGSDWVADQVDGMADSIERMTPVEFSEKYRYLPGSVTRRPGLIDWDVYPYWKEIINNFDIRSPVRESNVMKGVQIACTTALESIILYYIGFIKTMAMMFLTAEKELATERMENYILPMLNESGFAHVIQTSDVGNARKTGKTKDHLQWAGGGFMIYTGANNARKMRSWSVPILVKDELDAWKRAVGNDGNSDALTDARTTAFENERKIFRGSTPLTMPSMINDAYRRGDQRVYKVRCKRCSYPQRLKHRKPGALVPDVTGGFLWETEAGVLVPESVRYACVNCGFDHFEHDKPNLFAEDHGAAWVPTAQARERWVRSYHLPSFYSPLGFRSWAKCIDAFLAGYDPVRKQTVSVDLYQTYYNNTLGAPFTVDGRKVQFQSVSAHRRVEYKYGQIPNKFAAEHSGSKILFLNCTVDVHKRFLSVAILGWAVHARPYLIDYFRIEQVDDDDDCTDPNSPAWGRLQQIVEDREYTADDGQRYGIVLTLVDAGYDDHDAVTGFCADYESGVFPILGRDRPAKSQTIKEFAEFKTQAGTVGYRVTVDHYKDRMAAVLRRRWDPELGEQPVYCFNAPVDATDDHLKELTVEYRKQEIDPQGNTYHKWHRPPGSRNELWDLLGYGHAGVEIFAWGICIKSFELETIDWNDFWEFAMDSANDAVFCRLA